MKPRQLILLLVALLVFGALYVISDQKDFPVHQGLDIQGGMHIVLEAQNSPTIKVNDEVMRTVLAVIRNRVDAFGVAEPLIQQKGANQVVVDLPGIKDPERARDLIGRTAKLVFLKPTGPQSGLPAGTNSATGSFPPAGWALAGIDGSMLTDAHAELGQSGWVVAFKFNDEGARRFGDLTSQYVGKPIGIALDGRIISAPRVNEPILQGSGVIEGDFTAQQAQDLAVQLKAGALPVDLKEVEDRTVGPSLGQDAVSASIKAGIVGFAMVFLFMLAYYRLPGLVAGIALGIYAALVFAIFKLIPVTLTVPGIAGFILSIGMAVDANILIFERTKEELRRGRSLYSAIEIGFKRAFTAIFDSNSTTLLTCAILYSLGTGLVKGFALTLAIGVICSLFTAITVTRALLHQILEAKGLKQASYFGVRLPTGTPDKVAS